MNYKDVLYNEAKKLAAKFDDYNDIPLVVIGGSVGDPYGYVTSVSDIDLLVWTNNKTFISKEPAIPWEPYKFKARRGQKEDQAIDVLTGIEDKYTASVLFRLFDIKETKKSITKLTNKHNITRDELDNYIVNFVESVPYKDDANLYNSGKNAAIHVFAKHRGLLARKTLVDINLTMLKIRDDRNLSRNEPIDLRAYNDRVIDVVNAMTYILCCAKNIPRSYSSIVKRRNNILWGALGIERTEINAVLSASEEIEPSFEALREFVRKSYNTAKKEIPELENEYRVVRKIIEQ